MWACAVVALLSSWLWAVATPSFQVPDEIVHTGYVHYLGETGHVPRPIATKVGYFDLSDELKTAVEGVPFNYQGTPSFDSQRSAFIERLLDTDLERNHEQEAGSAANNPPLYYLAEAIPYEVARASDMYGRLLALRVFSALFAAITAAFTFLFVRELLPGTPWVWTVGGLAVALHPLAGFVSGGVNPDALLWAASAGLFLAIARVLRHGLTRRRALGVGAALAAGLLTKGAMFALLPGAVMALAIGVWRTGNRGRRMALMSATMGIAVGILPYIAWLAVRHLLYGEIPSAGATTGGVSVAAGVDLHKEASYIWQVYLPRMPFMNDLFPGYPLWDVYFEGFVGRFGYFFFNFDDWVNRLGLAVAVVVLALAGLALWRGRAGLGRRLPELATYVVLAVSLLLLLGVAGYQFTEREHIPFEQTRYLFPLLPLYGALVALAARGAGRYDRVAGLALVALLAAHNVFAVLLTIGHYYG